MLGQLAIVLALRAALAAWGGPYYVPPEGGSGQTHARGSLDKEIIRRVIGAHIDEVQSCYAGELSHKPELSGRIMVQFTIAASGQVVASALQESTMGSPPVEGCVVAAVGSWQFPRPTGGGSVIVSYPFVFKPGPTIEAGPSGQPHPHGSLDKGVILGVIRGHSDEVRRCYAGELSHKPELTGRVMVQFTIGASGQVVASVLESSTMGSPPVESCIVAAVRSWQFPKPLGGGNVTVSFPWVLIPVDPGPPPTVLVAGHGGAGAVELTTIEPGVYVHRSTDAHGVPSNGLVVIISGAGLLLVDTAWTAEQTEAILRWGDNELHAPWIGAVITHDHADRDGGLAALQRRGIPVGALDLTVAKLERRGVRGVTALFAAADGIRKDPRGFEAFYPGPGHASDNIVLRFPSLLYAGCLVKSLEENDLGFTGDADLRAWPDAIRKVRDRYRAIFVVPGHGPVDHSGKAYQHTLDLLRERTE